MDPGLSVSALVNPTFWIAGALLMAVVWPGTGGPAQRFRAVAEVLCRPAMLTLIAVLVFANIGVRAAVGHAVPGDFVQEVVAARAFAKEGTLYSEDVNADVREWLAADPPPVWTWLPSPLLDALHARQELGRNRLVAQAHPPTVLLATAPAVWWVGAYGAFWLVTALTVAAVAFAAHHIAEVMWPTASRSERWLTLLVLLGWQPVLATVRDGQLSVLVGALVIVGWAGMRERSSPKSGVAIGVAAALKLYPSVLLILMALRRRAAVTVAVSTVVAAAVLVTITAGPHTWIEYGRSARVISASFSDEPHNLAVVARLAGLVPSVWLAIAYGVAATVMLLATVGVVLRTARSRATSRMMDLEFGLFISLAFLLSPIAWHHYVFMLAQPLAVVLVASLASQRRVAVGVWLACVLVLSLPDDSVGAIRATLPDHPFLSAACSRGVVVALLWTVLLVLRCQPADGALVRSRLAAATVS